MPYASQSDLLTVGVPSTALGKLTPAQVAAELQTASDLADSYFRARWGTNAVPLLAPYDTQIVKVVAKLAAFELIVMRGIRTDGIDWELFTKQREFAVDWLDKVQRQQAHPKVVLALANAPGTPQPRMNSASVVNIATGAQRPNRGW